MREVASTAVDQSPVTLASDVADLVQKSRRMAATAKMPVYLGLGGFEDSGVNNRLADFPAALRAYLTAAYRESGVTLVEREFMDALLQEITLDEVGLAAARTNEPAARLQPAFWLVEGTYQSYETEQKEVELKLSVDRVLGRATETSLRKPPGTESFQAVKAFIDETIRGQSSNVYYGPAHHRKQAGRWTSAKRLSGIKSGNSFGLTPLMQSDPNEESKRRRNLAEARHAFARRQRCQCCKPTNREAKFGPRLVPSRQPTGEQPGSVAGLFPTAKRGSKPRSPDHLLTMGNRAGIALEVARRTAKLGTPQAEATTTNASAAAYYHQKAADVSPSVSDSTQAEAAKKDFFTALDSRKLTSHALVAGSEMAAYMRADSGRKTKPRRGRPWMPCCPKIKSRFPQLYPSLLTKPCLIKPT